MILDSSAIVAITMKEPGFEALLDKLMREPYIGIGAPNGSAVEAWLQFGKGRHPAGLNFGDCLSYATARPAEQPLLCVGDDFSKTDVTLA